MSRILVCIALATALAACGARPEASSPVAGTASAPTTTPPASAPPDVAAQPAVPAGIGADAPASFAGFGDAKFGTRAADMLKAWGKELQVFGKDDNPACYTMVPAWAKSPPDMTFMIGEGVFARYDSGSERIAAPGGGKVGMGTQELQALYHDALQATPHKYIEGGHYLTLPASAGSSAKLVFETDASGKVTAWHLGMPPQVDYVEGCS